MARVLNLNPAVMVSGQEFTDAFLEFRDAMIEISDRTSRIAHPGAGGLDAEDIETILEATETLRRRGPLLQEWLSSGPAAGA